MVIRLTLLVLFFTHLSLVAQNITGTVTDSKSGQPIESAAIYFDNTTIGTTTDEKGRFSIPISPQIKSPLIISFLGYKDVIISQYSKDQYLNISMKEAIDHLDEVFISYDDGLTRRQKLRVFRREFLGQSKFGSSCRILNEKDILLKYDKKNSKLYASASKPIKVENKKLKYLVNYDLIDFEVTFSYVKPEENKFDVYAMYFTGTTFYKDISGRKTTKSNKLRKEVYHGSIQHFMRALYDEDIEAEGYRIYKKGAIVKTWDYISIDPVEGSEIKQVTINVPINIIFKNDLELTSKLQVTNKTFFIDKYGNYSPVEEVLFSGKMGTQRIGDALPSDYKPE